jgi:4-amino-4-deoxy-L-arabinose transferase-like glycosyltransferase
MVRPIVRRPLLAFVPLVALCALFIVTGLRGVDLGEHWDEVPYHIAPVRSMAASGIFLPHEYIYPALSKWLVMLPAWPGVVATALRTSFDPAAMQATMQAGVDASDYLLKARRVFIVVSALALVWVYGTVFVLRRKPWAAFVAACGLGLSWEYAYHARWVANDCILAQFSALVLFLLALFHARRRRVWLYAAAVAAGLCMSTKQPGAFLLLPVLFSGIVEPAALSRLQRILRSGALVALAVAAFAATTPGALIEPFAFLRDGRLISKMYAAGHGGFTTKGAIHHLQLVLTYLSIEFFSPSKVVAVVLFALAGVGGFVWVRRDWRFGVTMLSLPVVYLTFFGLRYHVMLARNYMQLTPMLAVMLARGVEEIAERLKPRWARWTLAGALAAVAVGEAAWLIAAAETIRHVDPKQQVRDAVAYIAKHPRRQFRVSDNVRRIAAEEHLVLASNVTGPPGGDAVVIFGRADGGDPSIRRENDPWLTDATFGPLEVNFNWYAVWAGFDRVVVMPIEKAREGAAPIAR